jgi:hypothetical protein
MDLEKFTCPECEKFVMRTMSGALICPAGHGKVRGACTAEVYARARGAIRRGKWLARIPNALKLTKGKFLLEGRIVKRVKLPDRVSSSVSFGSEIPEGTILGRVGDRVYSFEEVGK